MDIELHLLNIEEKKADQLEAENSISILYEKFRKFVYNITYGHIGFILQKEELALNVVSEVFIKIWQEPLDWEYNIEIHKTQEDGFKAYLATISHYKLLEELRKTKNIRDNETTKIDDDDSEWKWSLLDTEFDHLDKELIKRRNLLDDCLLEFPERSRDIIRMYFLLYDETKRMSSENVALMEKTFGTTWQNIRQIIFRAKKKLEVVLLNQLQTK